MAMHRLSLYLSGMGEPKEWRQVILNLKIGDTYAGLAFSELEHTRWEQQNDEWIEITIPAARVLKARVKIV